MGELDDQRIHGRGRTDCRQPQTVAEIAWHDLRGIGQAHRVERAQREAHLLPLHPEPHPAATDLSALDASIHEVARLAGEQTADAAETLTWDQEAALAEDPKLLACLYLLTNGHTARELGSELHADEKQLRRWFARLHALGLIELRSKLRARVRAASAITWRKDGPIRRLYEAQVRDEFLRSTFSDRMEALHFRSAELSEASCRVLLRKLEKLANEFRELAELDRSLPLREKRSFAVLLASRPWVFSMFQSLKQ